MVTFAIIPARSGSKGVKDKNIKKLCGFSLIEWSIAACQKSNLIDEIYVSTDSDTYRKHALEKGAKVPYLRPKEISQDYSTDYEFIIHALNWFNENYKEPDIIALIRPTTPIRDPLVIDQAIDTFVNNNEVTSLRSIHEMSESAYKTFEISENNRLKCIFTGSSKIDFSNNARQTFPKTYVGNGYIDLIRAEYIKENKLIYGNKVLPFITPKSYEIDHKEDYELLKYQVSTTPNLINNLFS